MELQNSCPFTPIFSLLGLHNLGELAILLAIAFLLIAGLFACCRVLLSGAALQPIATQGRSDRKRVTWGSGLVSRTGRKADPRY